MTSRQSDRVIKTDMTSRAQIHKMGTVFQSFSRIWTLQPHDHIPPSCGSTKIVETLADITNTLSRVVKRLDQQESLLSSMERRIFSTPTPSSSSRGDSAGKPKVPFLVQVSLLIKLHVVILLALYWTVFITLAILTDGN